MAGQRFTSRLTAFTSIVAGFLTSFVLTLAVAPRADAYVYWTNPNDGTIGRANLDGSGADDSFITAGGGLGGNPDGLAVNSTHVYWSSGPGPTSAIGAPGWIGRARLDGTGVDHSFITGAGNPGGVTVNSTHVYWVSRRTDDWNPGTGSIGRANVNGTGIDENFITGLNYPDGPLAVDGSHLYWINTHPDAIFVLVGDRNRIGRANLDGTGIDENFITGMGADPDYPFWRVAVNDTHVWWAWSGAYSGGIERANLDGTSTQPVIGAFSLHEGDDGNEIPRAVAVDDTHLYWANGYGVGRARLDGTRVNHDFIRIGPGRGDVAVDGLGPPPSNDFRITGVKKNKRKGTARLTVKVPGEGDLELAKTTKMKADDELAEAAGSEKLRVKSKGKARKRLNTEGKAKVRAKVTYIPEGGEPNAQTKRVKLVKRR